MDGASGGRRGDAPSAWSGRLYPTLRIGEIHQKSALETGLALAPGSNWPWKAAGGRGLGRKNGIGIASMLWVGRVFVEKCEWRVDDGSNA